MLFASRSLRYPAVSCHVFGVLGHQEFIKWNRITLSDTLALSDYEATEVREISMILSLSHTEGTENST